MLRQDWLATAMAAAASKNDGGVLQRALLIRQQTETLTRYCGVLKLLHDYENTMANDAVRLVSTRCAHHAQNWTDCLQGPALRTASSSEADPLGSASIQDGPRRSPSCFRNRAGA